MSKKVWSQYEDLRDSAKTKAFASLDAEDRVLIQVGSATCEHAAGSSQVFEEFRRHIASSMRDDIVLHRTGCTGRCSREPIVTVRRPNETAIKYQKVHRDVVHEIFTSHVMNGEPLANLLLGSDDEDRGEGPPPVGVADQAAEGVQSMGHDFQKLYGDVRFFHRQQRIALRHNGVLDPESLVESLAHDGFRAVATVLDQNDPQWVIDQVSAAKLRGRGGGGFPTGLKWSSARKAEDTTRFLICNADEGDPGAFMDRSMLESDPFNVIEGMIIAAFAIGAQKGFFYVRAEYPLAIERLRKAIEQCHEAGLLGDNILGSDFSFDLEIRLGAGAFVCGEETALIHSIEGERGQPRIRPPFPTESGLWGHPTVINNVETFANIASIVNHGAEWFASIGTEKSGGTKVFALAGKVEHTGLVEVPMGMTLREIIFDIGGGVADGKEIKAVQTGGPAGGCIPAKYLDTPVDFDTLGRLGSIMGSGGMIVLDESDCMVDIAKFFMSFSQDESCGKCTPCREGTTRMLEILDRITQGKGEPDDIDKLQRLASLVKKSSLCGLGRAAPNPILSTIEHFREEYEAHVVDKKCPSGKCRSLVAYTIDPDQCVGCTVCARNCPVECISGERRQVHVIDQERCIKCGRCFEVCRFDAVRVG